jgi:hypothetical protein
MRDETPDYGIDASVEIVRDDGKVTGKRFFAQVKGTDQSDLRRALLVKLKIKTFRYLQGLNSPVLVVVYHAPTGRLYTRWVHDLDVFYASKSKTHFTFRLEAADALYEQGGAARIEEAVDDWRWLKSPTLTGPIVLRANLAAPVIRGIPRSEIMDRLEIMSSPLRGVLEIREVPLGKVRGDINVTPDDVHVRLYGGSGAAIHGSLREARTRGRRTSVPSRKTRAKSRGSTEVPPPLSTSDEVAADILAGIAMALHHAGHLIPAAQVVELAFSGAAVSRNPDAAAVMVGILIAADRHDIVAQAALAFTKAGCHDLSERSIAAIMVTPPPRERRDSLHLALEDWIAGLPVDHTPENLGTAHYNVGRYIGIRGWDPRGGISHFVKAARLYPSYRGRGYFWEELGAMFFQLDRFGWSALAYGKAGHLGRGPIVYAKQADALWRTGRYGDARDALTKYEGDDAHWLLLAVVLPSVIEVSGTECQTRQPELAGERIAAAMASGDPGTVGRLDRWTEVIRADGMASLAWFNLGVSYGASNEHQEAAVAFLIAALIRPVDAEAWANALVASILWAKNAEQETDFPQRLFGAIATAAAQFDRESFFRALVARLPSDTADGRQFWRVALGTVSEKAGIPTVMRITVDDNTVEVPLHDPDAALRILGDT